MIAGHAEGQVGRGFGLIAQSGAEKISLIALAIRGEIDKYVKRKMFFKTFEMKDQ